MSAGTKTKLRSVRQAAAILALASVVALAVNAVSPAGLSVTRPLPLKEIDSRYLTLEETKTLFEAGQSIFLDARRLDEYNRGHIPAALTFPAEEFTQRYIALAPLLPREVTLVAYCGGADCELSRSLADKLNAAGYPNVKIFYHGWNSWKNSGWPEELPP